MHHDRAARTFARRELSSGHREVNRSISAMRGPGERVDAELTNWRILRTIRSSPAHADALIDAVPTLIIDA